MFSLGTTLFELMTHRDLPGIVHDSDFSDEIKHGRRPRFLPKVCICSGGSRGFHGTPQLCL